MSNSSLITKYIPAYTGNYTKTRSKYGKLTEITVHHMAGFLTIEELGKLWATIGRNGSSHYGVNDTQIGQYVKEEDIAWTNSNWDSNVRAVTIEVANNTGKPNWTVSNASLKTTIKLVADIAKRNGLHPLVLGKTLTWHSMYAATECPGPYLKGKLQYIVDEANKINAGGNTIPPTDNPPLYRVRKSANDANSQLNAYSNFSSAVDLANKNVGYKVFDTLFATVYDPAAIEIPEDCIPESEFIKEIERRKQAEKERDQAIVNLDKMKDQIQNLQTQTNDGFNKILS